MYQGLINDNNSASNAVACQFYFGKQKLAMFGDVVRSSSHFAYQLIMCAHAKFEKQTGPRILDIIPNQLYYLQTWHYD